MEPIEVLLVEDNLGDVHLIQAALETGSIPKKCRVLKDGEAALKYLKRLPPYQDAPRPDLILLDLNLPRIDGREVLSVVKEHPGLHRIPVIILSSSGSDRDIRRSYELRANCYLQKPSDLDEFLELVQQVENYWLCYVALSTR